MLPLKIGVIMSLADHEFKIELSKLLNRFSIDNDLNIPDFILAESLVETLINMKKVQHSLDNYFNSFEQDLDGDHASALASAGFGTDEDYAGSDF
jgi:hypothetical protein